MKFTRRNVVHWIAGAAALPFSPHATRAQAYPTRPVRIVVGFPAGGGQDVVARLVGQPLSERLGQPFVVENKPGAATNLATEFVVNARPDGYTLIEIGPPAAINASLYADLRFNFLRDIAPVASLVRQPYVMVVDPSFPAKTVAEFITHAKANPGKLSMAGNGVGGGPHMAGELFKMMAGIDMLTVHYRGDTPALTDLLGGHVHVYFSGFPAAVELAKAGKLRALAVTGAASTDALPDVPAVAEFVPGYHVDGVFGLGAPGATPSAIIDQLNAAVNAVTADAKLKARLAALGCTVVSLSPAQYRQMIIDETRKWAKVIKAAGLKTD